jgi:hypothetical protein
MPVTCPDTSVSVTVNASCRLRPPPGSCASVVASVSSRLGSKASVSSRDNGLFRVRRLRRDCSCRESTCPVGSGSAGPARQCTVHVHSPAETARSPRHCTDAGSKKAEIPVKYCQAGPGRRTRPHQPFSAARCRPGLSGLNRPARRCPAGLTHAPPHQRIGCSTKVPLLTYLEILSCQVTVY